jgi:hypothetical protein
MHARVLFTNGIDTHTLYWLSHTGTDVYHSPHPNGKYSYHQSGESHYKRHRDGVKLNTETHAPVSQLKGAQIIGGLGFINGPGNFTGPHASGMKYKPQGSTRSDAILTIDSRTLPPDATVQLTIGLLEPGNILALSPSLQPHRVGGSWVFNTKQLLLNTSVEPWVWVKVDITTQEEINELIAREFPD